MLGEELPVDGDVRRIEKVERHDRAVVDQAIAELQAVVVDVVHERGDALAARPAGVSEACGERVTISMDARVLRHERLLGHRIVADEDHEVAAGERHAVIARAPRPAVWLRAVDDALALREHAVGVVTRAVVDHDHLEVGCVALPLQRVEHA